MRIDHVQLAIPAGSEDLCRAFWLNVPGCAEMEKPDHLKPRGGFWLMCGEAPLHFGVDPDFRPATKAHVAFEVADLDNLAAALTATNHAVRWDRPIDGRRRFFTDDPVGNRIEFIGD